MKGLAALCAGVMTLCATSFFSSCERLDVLDGQVEELQGDIKDLQGQIDALDARLKAVEALKAQLEALGTRITALEAVELAFQESSTTHELQYSLDGGKTWTGTGIFLAQVPELDFQVTANNELQVKYGNSGWETITTLAKNCEKNVTLRVNPDTNELEIAMDGTTYVGTGIILAENCDNEFKFQVNPDTKEVEFSFDGGKTWIPTGDKCVDPCAKPEVKFEETDEAITVWVGEESFVIAKPQQVELVIKTGKLHLNPEASAKVAIETEGIVDVTVVSSPKGWSAELDAAGKSLVVTAPKKADLPVEEDDPFGDDWGYSAVATRAAGDAVLAGNIKILAISADGRSFVGKIPVEVFVNPYDGYPEADLFKPNSVSVNGTQFMITFPGTYGFSTIDTYKDDIQSVIEYYTGDGMEEPELWTWGMEEYEEMPELEYGKEYVLWALPQENQWTCTYDDFYMTFFKPMTVNVKQDVEKAKSAFDVYVDVEVLGADSYTVMVVANPAIFTVENDGYDYNQLEQSKQSLLNSLTNPWGAETRTYTESYKGSLNEMGAYPQIIYPESDVYLLLLPIDGRANEDYTLADVREFHYTTEKVTAGGSLVPTIVHNAENTTYSYIEVTVENETDDFGAIYYAWIPDAEFEDYADDQAIIDYMLANPMDCLAANNSSYANLFFLSNLSVNTKMRFVALTVDSNNQYGELAVTEPALSTLDIDWSDKTFAMTTNAVVEDGVNVVKGKTTDGIKLDIEFPEEVTMIKYYTYTDNATYIGFYGDDPVESAKTLAVGGNFYPKEVTGNKATITTYAARKNVLLVLPYDADGKPVKEAIVYRFTTVKE